MNTVKRESLDLAAIKRAVTIEQVLNHYGVGPQFRRSGANLFGACPLHGGHNKDQFHASLTSNSWFCFGDCQRGGSILDFVKHKEGVGLREAAELIKSWFSIPSGNGNLSAKRRETRKADKPPVNLPLRFALRQLGPVHPYLRERGMTPETIADFGVGYCSVGSMAGRIAIPIHDRDGNLVAYAGRWPGKPPERRPRYKLPRGFRKSLEVFNLHRAAAEDSRSPLIVVEGYFDCMKIWQAGFRRTVAIMGSRLSEIQAALIGEAAGESGVVRLLFDNDKSGSIGRSRARSLLKPFVSVETVELGVTQAQPDRLSSEEIRALLG